MVFAHFNETAATGVAMCDANPALTIFPWFSSLQAFWLMELTDCDVNNKWWFIACVAQETHYNYEIINELMPDRPTAVDMYDKCTFAGT